jgi:uncharacterized protein YeeX (DUF496 family)
MSQPITTITEANVMEHELAIMLNAKQVVDHFMPTPGSYPPAPQVAKAVLAIQALMKLVYAQQRIVIEAENALQPTLERMKEAEARVIVVEKMRDDAEEKYNDLLVQMANLEQGIHDEYNSLQS